MAREACRDVASRRKQPSRHAQTSVGMRVDPSLRLDVASDTSNSLRTKVRSQSPTAADPYRKIRAGEDFSGACEARTYRATLILIVRWHEKVDPNRLDPVHPELVTSRILERRP
jgi:hypothetical protein